MMNLKIQIGSILVSFIFGILFSLCTNLNYRFLYSKNKYFKLATTIIYVLDAALLYFLVLIKINKGIIHPYFFIAIFLGFILGTLKLGKYMNYFKSEIKKCVKNVKKKKVL